MTFISHLSIQGSGVIVERVERLLEPDVVVDYKEHMNSQHAEELCKLKPDKIQTANIQTTSIAVYYIL